MCLLHCYIVRAGDAYVPAYASMQSRFSMMTLAHVHSMTSEKKAIYKQTKMFQFSQEKRTSRLLHLDTIILKKFNGVLCVIQRRRRRHIFRNPYTLHVVLNTGVYMSPRTAVRAMVQRKVQSLT